MVMLSRGIKLPSILKTAFDAIRTAGAPLTAAVPKAIHACVSLSAWKMMNFRVVLEPTTDIADAVKDPALDDTPLFAGSTCPKTAVLNVTAGLPVILTVPRVNVGNVTAPRVSVVKVIGKPLAALAALLPSAPTGYTIG